VLLDRADGVAVSAEAAADVALGIVLRSYSFDKYKTKKKPDESPKPRRFTLAVADPKAAQKAWKTAGAVAEGVSLARDLVNEPANALGPVEFADKLGALSALGVESRCLGEAELQREKMGALLAWRRARRARPRRGDALERRARKTGAVSFVGKGVVLRYGRHLHQAGAGMRT
jgi:leucyl aminopeptidase